jgi:restriction system protein
MAEVTSERTGELLRKLFEILMARPEGMRAKDALAELARSVRLTPHEEGQYARGQRRFEKIVRFATVDTVKAGWFQKSKGTWTVTDEGRNAYKKYTSPTEFYKEAARLYRDWNRNRPELEETEIESEDLSEREATQTFEEAEERAWEEIKQFVQKMPPYEFQNMVGDLLKAMGYHIAWIAPPGKDGGLDLLAWSDPLGTKTPRIKVQVKRRADNVAVGELRAFMAVLGEDDVGLFVTAGDFTKDAESEARTQEKRKITLINLERFFDLWVDHWPKLDEAARRRFPIRPIYFVAPIDQ